MFTALPKWSCVLKMCAKENKPKLFGFIEKKECYLSDIHVSMKKKKSWLGLPSVDYITLKGYVCQSNEYVEHRIKQ